MKPCEVIFGNTNAMIFKFFGKKKMFVNMPRINIYCRTKVLVTFYPYFQLNIIIIIGLQERERAITS